MPFFSWPMLLIRPLIFCNMLRKNPYTYFNHNINSCAISLRGKKMSFCSFVIENHNKIYGSVNCTESHERFIFIHHASSQRTLRTYPECDFLKQSKGSTMHSATSRSNPHLNYCYQNSQYNFFQFSCIFFLSQALDYPYKRF